ncbi:MAG: hypothetical protein ACRC5S_10315 [Cetobacterium sp.]
MKFLDFNNLKKYKDALDDGFSWSNIDLYSPSTGLSLQKNSNGNYVLAAINFKLKKSETIISEKDFKIFSEKVKLAFSKDINKKLHFEQCSK